MVIAGAGGHGKEVLALIKMQGISSERVLFFDEAPADPKMMNECPVIQSTNELESFFEENSGFILGVGNPIFRERLDQLLSGLGGNLTSMVASTCVLQSELNLSDVMAFGFLGPNVKLGRGVLINTRASVHHDCQIGEYSEIGPGAIILGNVRLGKKCRIGAGAVILPGIVLGDEVVVGAGAVVTKPISSHQVVMGIPAKVKNANL